MKKALCLLLAFLMSATLLPGCREETPQESTGTTEIPTQSTEEAASRVVNGVYATCGDYKYTIRSKGNACITFYLMTEKPLPKDATITLETESTYRCDIFDRTPKDLSGASYPNQLALWVEYGVDYAELFERNEKRTLALYDYSESKITLEEYTAIQNAYTEFVNKEVTPHSEQVDKIKNGTPPFYFYEVELRVKHSATEVIRECQLVAGDMSRTIQIGEITQIYETDVDFARFTGTGVKQYQNHQVSTVMPDSVATIKAFSSDNYGDDNYPYSPNMRSTKFLFVAEKDIVLTELASVDKTVEIKNVDIVIVGNSGQVTLTWTPGTELAIRKGETVYVHVAIDHPDLHDLECCINGELRLFYNDADGGGYMRTNYGFLRRRPLMEMYLWAFRETDTKDYCERYFKHQGIIGKYLTNNLT